MKDDRKDAVQDMTRDLVMEILKQCDARNNDKESMKKAREMIVFLGSSKIEIMTTVSALYHATEMADPVSFSIVDGYMKAKIYAAEMGRSNERSQEGDR